MCCSGFCKKHGPQGPCREFPAIEVQQVSDELAAATIVKPVCEQVEVIGNIEEVNEENKAELIESISTSNEKNHSDDDNISSKDRSSTPKASDTHDFSTNTHSHPNDDRVRAVHTAGDILGQSESAVKVTPQIPPQSTFFEFRFGEDKAQKFSGVVNLVPFRKTSLSLEIMEKSSFDWTKIITEEKFEKAQLDFRGGFKNTCLSCVLGIEVPNRLDSKLEAYRKEALGCILDGWEFLLLIHKSHFIYSIMSQECLEDGDDESLIVLGNCKYFLLCFAKGWRQTQKRAPLSSKSNHTSQKKRSKPQEISKSNYVIKDFGKAKLLTKPISSLQTTTTIITSRKDSTSRPSLSLTKGKRDDSLLLNESTHSKRNSFLGAPPEEPTKSTESFVRVGSANYTGAFHSEFNPSHPPNYFVSTNDILDNAISDLTSVPSDYHQGSKSP